MNMPGFTAEDALYRNHQLFASAVHHPFSNDSQVTPQLRPVCFIRSFARTFSRCVSIGYDVGTCDQVAWDLAMSVCD